MGARRIVQLAALASTLFAVGWVAWGRPRRAGSYLFPNNIWFVERPTGRCGGGGGYFSSGGACREVGQRSYSVLLWNPRFVQALIILGLTAAWLLVGLWLTRHSE